MSTDVSTATAVPASLPARYGRLWIRVPKEVAYLFIAFPISVTVFSVVISLFSAGAGTIVTFFIGVVLIIATLYIARGFGTLDLALLRWTGQPPVVKPDWQDARARTGFFGWLRAVLGNGHYWLYLLYAGFVHFVLSTISWSIMITWVATALGGLTYWFWSAFLPQNDRDFYPAQWLLERLGFPVADADGRVVESIAYLVLGVIFAVHPAVRHPRTDVAARSGGARDARRVPLRGAQARGRDARRVARRRRSSAEGTALRRLERDIHDGPQQRLVRMQMDLAAADRQLDQDPDAARTLIAEALQQSKDALDELRALSRGFAPPILLDRGLVRGARVARGAVDGADAGRVDAAGGHRAAAELERNAYFIAAEALTQRRASTADAHERLRSSVSLRRVPEPDETWLDLVVTDDGHGGATAVAGHGIAGLQERARGLGGTARADAARPAARPSCRCTCR